MIKRLALLCCILLLPTIAAAQSQVADTNYGDWWVGGQVGGTFASETDAGVLAGAIVGYNFCIPNRPAWQRYFGAALDFQWNQFNHTYYNFDRVDGNQFALSLLARLQYPLMGDERFTTGRFVPFLMFGPAIIWSTHGNINHFDDEDTSTDWGVVAEIGFEYFFIPKLSIGPSFRYRHVWIGTESQQVDQFMVLGRLAYHF